MSRYRNALPQLSGEFFLADAGLETDLIFNHGIQIRELAAHTDLAANERELHQANRDSVAFIAGLRAEFSGNNKPIVLNGLVGPRGNAYASGTDFSATEAKQYHSKQMGWLAATEVDMGTAATFPHPEEAIGVVRAARAVELPVIVSFTVETDGKLPNGQSLQEAIATVDRATDSAAAYFMVNCAHPDHFAHLLTDSAPARRVRGLRCNASRLSHDELDQVLDDGDPEEFGRQYKALAATMPWLNIFGGCCGSDLRHVTQVARALAV
jgi:homocysteine S-methyltransferase